MLRSQDRASAVVACLCLRVSRRRFRTGPAGLSDGCGRPGVFVRHDGHAHAFEAATGRVLWARDLATELQANINTWGITSAPLVVRDLVIFQVGGQPDACLVALDVVTGRERWRALDGRASYSPPRLVRLGDRELVLAWTAHWLAGLEPETGKVLWKHAYKPKNMILNVPDPVLDEANRRIFLTAFYDGAHLFDVKTGGAAPELLWQARA